MQIDGNGGMRVVCAGLLSRRMLVPPDDWMTIIRIIIALAVIVHVSVVKKSWSGSSRWPDNRMAEMVVVE